MQKLHFYTTGEGFTNLLHDFFLSGEFSKITEILSEQLPKEVVKDYLLGKYYFEGTTKNGESLSLIRKNYDVEKFKEDFLTGYRTCISTYNQNNDTNQENLELKNNFSKIEDLKVLLNYFSFEEVQDYLSFSLLKTAGWKEANSLENNPDGVILQNGLFIRCRYQKHTYLYEDLFQLGLASSSCWTECKTTLHLSSHYLSGYLADQIRYFVRKESELTEPQIQTLFQHRKSIYGLYEREDGTLMYNFLHYFDEKTGMGGKYNNLSFLKCFYSNNISIPLIYLSLEETTTNKVFIRTSPERSLPGLLNSKLIDKKVDKVDGIIKIIEKDFENCVKKLNQKDSNKLHYFFQDYIEGDNGVCHYDSKGFRYQVSTNQGDIVNGKVGNTKLDYKVGVKLEKFCSELYQDLQKPLQLEFVIQESDSQLFIVQLRTLSNHFESTVIAKPNQEKVIVKGLTFSKGSEEVDVKDILIVDSDGVSELLIGKKALIVQGDVEFSHLLALSKALKIPSMYSTGKVDLSKYSKVKFISYNYGAWIESI